MYTLTITCESLDTFVELARLIDSNGLTLPEFTELKKEEAPQKSSRKTKAKEEVKVEAPLGVVSEAAPTASESEPSAITYDQVKSKILDVVKNLGREASLDLLAPFGVVKGEGNDRRGKMDDLKPEQYAAVIAKAKEMLS